MKERISTVVGTLIIIIMALTAGAFVFKIDKFDMQNLYQPVKNQIKNKKTDKTVCTMEAKLCPDGTYVSRSGPNCEFAACPGESTIDTSDWQTYRNEKYGLEFKYPNEFKVYNDYPNKNQFFISENNKGDIRSPIDGLMFIENSENADKSITQLKNRDELTTVFKEGPLIINGVNIRKIVLSAAIGYNDAHYFFEKNGKNFEIIANGEDEVHEKIISTFKFTN